MRQYLDLKTRHADCTLLFRLGDFYEMFFEDAVVASRLLNLVLTTRDKGRENAVPMCGIPHHAVTGYVQRLLNAGHKIAICEQMEDPSKAKGLVRREVTQVVTPGVILDLEQLDARAPNYLCAVAPAGAHMGVAVLDLSTCEFRAMDIEGQDMLADELARLRPRELVCPRGTRSLIEGAAPDGCVLREVDSALFEDIRPLTEEIGETFASPSFGNEAITRAAAAALAYARASRPGQLMPALRLVITRPSDHMILDQAALRHLEIQETQVGRQLEGSLFGVMDQTVTAMGGRRLRNWLLYPLMDVEKIRRRQEAVAYLIEHVTLRQSLRELLQGVHDLERLASRVALGLSKPREIDQIRQSLRLLPKIRQCMVGVDQSLGASPDLLGMGDDDLGDLLRRLEAALREPPALTPRDGPVLRDGMHAELDELRRLAEGGRAEILAIEQRERDRTGVSSLRVRYNRVFGYFIEVTRSNLKAVPDDYTRKQTIAGGERFVTAELADLEARVLGAEDKRIALETDLFEALRRELAEETDRLRATANHLASIDALSAFAEVAHRNGYVCPEVDDTELLEFEDGRHPVVEQLASRGTFVPNDARLLPSDEQVIVLTGPNMAGKSTYMRQTALIALLAQAGSFVPARRARVGLVDRVFTRVGAVDDVARGESTFMVEMRECAHILRSATRRSLIVLDEIGRGTATYDGISIAWAVAEYLHDRIGCRTLFATHYHELCALADVKPRVRNYQVTVGEARGDIVFLRRVVPGGANRSYGIQVARLAGLPPTVVARAGEILLRMEFGARAAGGPPAHGAPELSPQLDLFVPTTTLPSPVAECLRNADPDRMTPLEALSLVADLKAKLV